MEGFVIAVPSYKRAEKQNTVEYLAGLEIPKNEIFLFVQTAKDWREYQKYSDRATIILKEAHGVAEARNNVLNTLVRQKNVLMMDDDILSFSRLDGKGLKPIKSREEFARTINTCFRMAKEGGAEMFGIYPVHNAFYMDRSISTKVTVNTVLGFFKGTGLRFDEKNKAKEDIELCGRILAGGGRIYRYNFLAPDAKHRTNEGGCNDVWKTEANKKAVEMLSRNFPEIFVPNSRKPNEVRMVLKDEKLNMKGEAL